jgi:hypothetical protein
MLPILRVIALLLAVLTVGPTAARASALPPDTTTLQFRGFRAGAPLEEIASLVRGLPQGRLHCDQAKKDRRVTECRGGFADSALGGPVELWISAIDSVAGIITLRSDLDVDGLEQWRSGLVARYGKVGARAQGTQWMMQWVRRGRMLRLTWRQERGDKVASVSLVDGRVLDGWGRDRARRSLVSRDSTR